MRKRITAAATIFISMLGLIQTPALATEYYQQDFNSYRVEVIVNSKITEIQAFYQNGCSYIEAQRILEAFGWITFFNADTQQIAANSRDGEIFVHEIGSAYVSQNNEWYSFASASVSIDETVYFPLSMLSGIIRPDGLIEDTDRHRVHMYKYFIENEYNREMKKILQCAGECENYNPLNYHRYLQYQYKNPQLPKDKVILYVNIGVDKAPYTDIQIIDNPHDVFVVVDKNHKFANDFVPNVTNIGGFYWIREAGEAWLRMQSDARAQGIYLSLNNTYRSISAQSVNYYSKINSGRSVENVDATNSRPGHSEHHTGYTADLSGLYSFVGTKGYYWVVNNAHKYGFVISFQSGKEFINNYSPEGWHIRWFPEWAAEIMYVEGLTIQEFENLYVYPRKHGFQTDMGIAGTIAETDFANGWDFTATPTASTVIVNGQDITFDAYNIGGNNYFKLRDLAFVLSNTEKQFEVDWDGDGTTITIASGLPYTVVGGEMQGRGQYIKTPDPTVARIIIDGRESTFVAYNIDGNNYFRLRDIGETFDFEVDWDGINNTVIIDTGRVYTFD